MSSWQLTRRQVLVAGTVGAAGAMTLRAGAASADGEVTQLSVRIDGAPRASAHVYEVALGTYDAGAGRSGASRGAPERTSPWSDTTIAFRVPADGPNTEIHEWVASTRQGRSDHRDVVVAAVLPEGRESRYVLHRCTPVGFAPYGAEDGVGLIEVLALSVADVTTPR